MLTKTQAHDLKIMHDLAVKAAVVAYAATPGTQTKRLKERAAEKADAKFDAALAALSR